MYQPGNWGPSNYPPPPQPPMARPSAGRQLAAYAGRDTVQPSLAGRMVDSFDDIAPDEVPMDGSLAVFPQSDLSCIHAKAWTDNGIVNVRYIPEKVIKKEPAPATAIIPEDFKQAIFERLDKIEQFLGANQPKIDIPGGKRLITKEDINHG